MHKKNGKNFKILYKKIYKFDWSKRSKFYINLIGCFFGAKSLSKLKTIYTRIYEQRLNKTKTRIRKLEAKKTSKHKIVNLNSKLFKIIKENPVKQNISTTTCISNISNSRIYEDQNEDMEQKALENLIKSEITNLKRKINENMESVNRLETQLEKFIKYKNK